MFCMNCGNQVADTNRFCPKCGTAVGQVAAQPAKPAYEQVAQEQPMYQVPNLPAYEELSWNGFYKRFVSKGMIVAMSIICFVTAAISMVLGIVMENPIGWLDVVVYLVAGIGVLAAKHWIFSLIATAYGGVWSVISLGTSGTPSGVFAVFVGVMCTITLIKARKAYALYCSEHIVPDKL